MFFQVNFVDFGWNELVMVEDLFLHTKFTEVPIQVRKCRVLNFVPYSGDNIDLSTQALKRDISLIIGHSCTFYIHDHLNQLDLDSILCTVCPLNGQLDLASSLITQGLAENEVFFGKQVKFNTEKRHRRECVGVARELLTLDDFKSYYDSNKVNIPRSEVQSNVEDEYKYEIFDFPCRRSVLDGDSMKSTTNYIKNEHHIIDRITEYFDLLQLNYPTIFCWPFYVVDPITVLIKPVDTQPPTIRVTEKQEKYVPLQGLRKHFISVFFLFPQTI